MTYWTQPGPGPSQRTQPSDDPGRPRPIDGQADWQATQTVNDRRTDWPNDGQLPDNPDRQWPRQPNCEPDGQRTDNWTRLTQWPGPGPGWPGVAQKASWNPGNGQWPRQNPVKTGPDDWRAIDEGQWLKTGQPNWTVLDGRSWPDPVTNDGQLNPIIEESPIGPVLNPVLLTDRQWPSPDPLWTGQLTQ